MVLSVCKQFSLLVLLGLSLPLYSAVETYNFNNEVERKRYNTFIDELRCPKCQNQNLAGSDSPIAADLRRELHRMVQAGQSDTQIVDFMVTRYGEFVLYRPRMTLKTVVLWLAPVLFLIIGIAWVIWIVRKQQNKPLDSSLSQSEQNTIADLLSKQAAQLTPRQKQNIALYQQRLDEIDAQLASASIHTDDYAAIKLEAQRNLLSDFDSDGAKAIQPNQSPLWPKALLALSVLALPVAVWGIYQTLGATPDVVIHQKITDFYAMREQNAEQEALINAQNELIDLMENRLSSKPNKLDYAAILAQIYTQRGEHLKAAQHYHSISLARPDNATHHAQLAQSLYFANERKITPAVANAMDKTLAIDPKNPIVLGLQGIHFFTQKQYEPALRAWQRLLTILPSGSPQANLIERGIMQAQLKLAVSEPAKLAPEPKLNKDNSKLAKQIRVSVSLPTKVLMAKGVTPNTRVFILAKALVGPPMPLAIHRLNVVDFPATVVLDDSTAMMESMTLSAFDEVEVIVRVSISGETKAQTGDFEARSGKITLSDKPVAISLSPDTLIP